MADNTQINTGAGDIIRTIQRTAAKTEVIVQDIGGEAGPESLVTTSNPLPVYQPIDGIGIINLLTQILLELRAMRMQDATVHGVIIDPETNELAVTPNWN